MNAFTKEQMWARTLLVSALFAGSALAQGDPWTSSATNLNTAFTGPIATMLMGVAIVVGGLTFAFSEGAGKRTLAGITFGGGMAIGATRFLNWLYS